MAGGISIDALLVKILVALGRGTYSFWASMMTRALSLVEAVEGETPISSLKAFAIVMEDGNEIVKGKDAGGSR
jgi:hypothetical protein